MATLTLTVSERLRQLRMLLLFSSLRGLRYLLSVRRCVCRHHWYRRLSGRSHSGFAIYRQWCTGLVRCVAWSGNRRSFTRTHSTPVKWERNRSRHQRSYWRLAEPTGQKRRYCDYLLFWPCGAPEGRDTYWVTYNANIDDLYTTALNNNDITEMLARIESERVITFLDSCYSAATVNRKDRTRTVQTEILGEIFRGKDVWQSAPLMANNSHWNWTTIDMACLHITC